MTVKQVAARLEVSVATVYGLVAAGKLRCHRIGLGRGCIRVTEEHVAEFLGGGVKPQPAPARRPTLEHLG